MAYHIQPNYCTVHLSFSKLLRKLMVKNVTTCIRGTLKKDQQKTYLMMLLRFVFFLLFFSDFLYKSICYGYSLELHGQVDAIQMGITTYAFIKK